MQRAKQIITSVVEQHAHATPAKPKPVHHRPPAAIVRQVEPKVDVVTPEFLAYIRNVENPQRVGWDKAKKRWFPHKDPSGGFNIGYGHHFQSDEEYQRYKAQGMSNEDVERLLVRDIQAAQQVIQRYIQRRYKVNLQLTPHQEQMLVDYVFNSGGLDKFPKMVDAVLRSDKERMKGEYKRYANIGGKKRELTGRNTQFASQFLAKESLC